MGVLGVPVIEEGGRGGPRDSAARCWQAVMLEQLDGMETALKC